MTKCEQCGGAYANGYTRCPECAPTDAVAQARENELGYSRLLGEAIVKHLSHDTRAMEEILHHANMRVEFAREAVRAECADRVRPEVLAWLESVVEERRDDAVKLRLDDYSKYPAADKATAEAEYALEAIAALEAK